jgi:hypothetical protein
MPRALLAIFLLMISVQVLPLTAVATTAPGSNTPQKKFLYRGSLRSERLSGSIKTVPDGQHNFRVRLYSQDGALVHEESLLAEVRDGRYDIVLGSAAPLYVDIKDLSLSISVNGSQEVKCCDNLGTSSTELREIDASQPLREMQAITPIIPDEVSARAVERYAIANGFLKDVPFASLPSVILERVNLMTGLHMEVGLALEQEKQAIGYYEAGKYGRINVEYNNLFEVGGDMFGLVGQAMHVAHHMLFYSAGVSTDVNGDGMFMFTVGQAHYRVGNRRYEPFVDAPFMRMKFHSSPEKIFVYGELETTMHMRSLVTGTVGLGFRLSPLVKFIGGLHHTEFWMPTEKQNRVVEGLHGIFSWGI